MKKYFIPLLGLVLTMGFCATALAATTASVNIKVTVNGQTVSIERTGNPDIVVAVDLGSSTVTSSCGFHNNGNAISDWSLQASTFTNGANTWTLLAGNPGDATGKNVIRLAGVFRLYSNIPLLADFKSNDVITTSSSTPCSDSVFAVEPSQSWEIGSDVSVGSSGYRDIFFRIDTPSDPTTDGLATEMTSAVTVSAAASF